MCMGWVCAHVCRPVGARGAEVIGSWELPSVGANVGPLQKQYALLTAELPLRCRLT